MFVSKLDRTRWKLKDAFHHAGCALHRYFERELGQRVPRKTKSAELIDEFDDHYQQLGEDDVLLALRDGDLIATGRYSSEQNPNWPEQEPQWIFHSGAPQPINRSCPTGWCRNRRSMAGSGSCQAARAGRLTIGLWLTAVIVSSVM